MKPVTGILIFNMDGITIFIIAGLFTLFLFLWFYRMFELKSLKNKYDAEIKSSKSESVQELKYLNLQQQPAKKQILDGCLTGKFTKRNCFFLDEGKSQQEVGVEESLMHEAMMLLFPKINQTVFCEHACKIAISDHNRFIKLVPLIIYDKNSHEIESFWDYFLKLPVNGEEPVNGKRIPEDNGHPIKSQLPVQPFNLAVSLKEEAFLRQVFHLIQDNFSDYRYSVDNLSLGLNMSVSQINRRLNSLTGYPAGHFIRSFRLGKAASLLIRKTGNISDICFKCGFNDLGYFSRAFKNQFGCSPTIYNKLMTKKSEFNAFIG